MKKLMTVIAAAAMSFGLFADALDNGWKASEKTAANWNADELWTGDGLAAGATFVEGQYLQIKSPSAAVTRKIVADGTFSVTSNVFFDVDLDLLGQALDEVPAVAEGTKLALFVLDPAEITTGLKVAPAAGLYAIAGSAFDGVTTQVLYRLNVALDELTNGVNKITVKGYDNVLKGDTANAGFIVYTRGDTTGDATACAIDAAYTVNQDGTWTDLNYNSNTYLKDKTIPKLSMADKRICVLLNLVGGVDGQDFAGLDFLGNANVATVTMNETGFDYIPADAQDMIIALADDIEGVANPEGIWDKDTGVVTGTGTITLSAVGKDIFKFVEDVDDEIASIADDTLTIKQLAPGEAFSVVATKSVATVTTDAGTEKFDDIAKAVQAANEATAATLKLAGDVDKELAFQGQNVTLDLAGNAVTAKITNDGILKIVDTVGEGSVTASPTAVENTENCYLTIEDGIFNGAVATAYEETPEEYGELISITGGFFSVKPDVDKDVVIPEGKEFVLEDDYWVLKDVQQDIDIKDAVITLAADSIEFGEDAPAIESVVVNETTLTEGDDYTVTCDYEKGVSGVGTYTYTLTAVKDSGYTGTATKDFTVTAKAVTPTITFDPAYTEVTWVEGGQLPQVTVGGDYEKDVDYTAGWGDGAVYPAENPEEAVTFTYTVTMQGNYTGTESKTFTIKPAETPVEPAEKVIEDKVDTTGMSDQEKAAVKANTTLLTAAFADDVAATEAWITNIYGEGEKIDGAKLAATKADLITASVTFDLPIMADGVEIAVANAEAGAGFTFAITDGDGDTVSVAKAKLQQMVKYTAALDTAFDDSTGKVAFDENPDETFTARFVEGPAAGFMKVDLTVNK